MVGTNYNLYQVLLNTVRTCFCVKARRTGKIHVYTLFISCVRETFIHFPRHKAKRASIRKSFLFGDVIMAWVNHKVQRKHPMTERWWNVIMQVYVLCIFRGECRHIEILWTRIISVKHTIKQLPYQIQRCAVKMRQIFYRIPTKYTTGEKWSIICDLTLIYICLSQRSAVWNIVLYWIAL